MYSQVHRPCWDSYANIIARVHQKPNHPPHTCEQRSILRWLWWFLSPRTQKRRPAMEWQGDQELAAAGRRPLLWITSGHADPLHCSLHCPYVFIQLHYTHGETDRPFLRPWPADPCVFRDKQPVPGTLRMVNWWMFIKEQCKLSKREGRRRLVICLEPLPVSHWLSLCLFTILSLSLLLWHQTTKPSR